MHDEYEISMEKEKLSKPWPSTWKREGEKEPPHKTRKRGREVV